MDLLALKRDLPSIEDGRWVKATELPGLQDMAVKVRGQSSKPVRECYAAKERALSADDRDGGKVKPDAAIRLSLETLAEATLVDIQGLTIGGEVVTLEKVRAMLPDPAFQPLADLVIQASFIVDRTRANRAEELKGN